MCTDTLHRFLDFLFLISKTEVMKYYLVPEVEGRVKLKCIKISRESVSVLLLLLFLEVKLPQNLLI